MASKITAADEADFVRRYRAGKGLHQIAADAGVSMYRVRKAVLATGEMRPAVCPRRVVADPEMTARYRAGESEKALAAAFGISRTAIRKRLLLAGVEPRGASDAMLVRMAQVPVAERRAGAAAANAARRAARTTSMDDPGRQPGRHLATVHTADRRCRMVGQGEAELRDLLLSRGLAVEEQTPIYGYNLDLSIGTVAVEVWGGKGYPFRWARQVRRTVDLGNLGWSSIYIWCSDRPPTKGAADQVVAFLDECRRDPTAIGPQYRVVRGDGEFVTGGRAQRDDIALEPTAGNRS